MNMPKFGVRGYRSRTAPPGPDGGAHQGAQPHLMLCSSRPAPPETSSVGAAHGLHVGDGPARDAASGSDRPPERHRKPPGSPRRGRVHPPPQWRKPQPVGRLGPSRVRWLYGQGGGCGRVGSRWCALSVAVAGAVGGGGGVCTRGPGAALARACVLGKRGPLPKTGCDLGFCGRVCVGADTLTCGNVSVVPHRHRYLPSLLVQLRNAAGERRCPGDTPRIGCVGVDTKVPRQRVQICQLSLNNC